MGRYLPLSSTDGLSLSYPSFFDAVGGWVLVWLDFDFALVPSNALRADSSDLMDCLISRRSLSSSCSRDWADSFARISDRRASDSLFAISFFHMLETN